MILGLSMSTFTLIHVVISLVGLLSGAVVLVAMIGDKRREGWTALFLVTTAATSLTGFLFPAGFDPAHVVGIISLVAVALAVLGLYGGRLAGVWRPVFIISAALAFYLNVFVGVVQAFQKLPFLQALAPTQSEPPFLVAQLVVLIAIIALSALAVSRFHPRSRMSA
jgi:hypothetical protein